MNKVIKSTLAGVFAFAIIGTSAMPSAQTISTLFDDTSISASAAASCCSFNASTGTLTLSGNVSKNDVQGYKDKAKSVVCKAGTSFPKDCSDMFSNFKYVTSIDLTNASTKDVTNMDSMFSVCWELKSVNFGNINTSQVTNMCWMFYCCPKLTTIKNLTTLDTKNVTNMAVMFGGCESLTSLDLKNFNTAKVTNMSNMFCGCYNLTTLKIDKFNTANVTIMNSMFGSCEKLTSLNLKNFSTAKVTTMSGMFSGCSSLKTLNLSSFDTSKVTNMYMMFARCDSLKNIYVSSKWSTANVKEGHNIFMGCKNLRGGNGSICTNDIYSARIDKKGQMGYLSLLGDVDFDGKVTEDDAFLILDDYTDVTSGKKHCLNSNQLAVADVDFNGTVELEDAQYTLIYAGSRDKNWYNITH